MPDRVGGLHCPEPAVHSCDTLVPRLSVITIRMPWAFGSSVSAGGVVTKSPSMRTRPLCTVVPLSRFILTRVRLRFSFSGTQAAAADENGVKSTLPVTLSQPNTPGPPGQPHQLFSASIVPETIAEPSAPTPLRSIEFECAVTFADCEVMPLWLSVRR